MSAPTLTLFRDPATALEGMLDEIQRLRTHFRLTFEWTAMADDIGFIDFDELRVVINTASDVEDQIAFLQACWNLCTVGSYAVPDLVPTTRRAALRLIPGQSA